MKLRSIAWLGLCMVIAACPYAPTLGEGPVSSTSSGSSGAPTTTGPTTSDATTQDTTTTGTTIVETTIVETSETTVALTDTSDTSSSTAPPAVCGDGIVGDGEACDDGALMPGDLCSASCEPTTISQLAPGASFTCVGFESGEMRCWGDAWFGYDDDTPGDAPGELPTAAVAVGGKVVEVAAGGGHTCALLDTMRVRCWGDNDKGELGYGDKHVLGDQSRELPTPDVDLGGDVQHIAAGLDHNCAVMVGGGLRCWGGGTLGVLGYGSIDDLGDTPGELPTPEVTGLDMAEYAGVKSVDTSLYHTCVVTNAGPLLCWGHNAFGQLGLGHKDIIGDEPGEMPPVPVDVGGVVEQVAVGTRHTCALMNDQGVRCWGDGPVLGYGSIESIGDAQGEMPPVDVAVGVPVKQLATGLLHTCALLTDGRVRCWGENAFGQLGYGHTNTIGDEPGEMPPADVDLGGEAMMIASLTYHTCALLVDGTLRCWGYNAGGQLGYGHVDNIGDDETPASAGPVPF